MPRIIELAISGTVDIGLSVTIILDIEDEEKAAEEALRLWEAGEKKFKVEDADYDLMSILTDTVDVVGNTDLGGS